MMVKLMWCFVLNLILSKFLLLFLEYFSNVALERVNLIDHHGATRKIIALYIFIYLTFWLCRNGGSGSVFVVHPLIKKKLLHMQNSELLKNKPTDPFSNGKSP